MNPNIKHITPEGVNLPNVMTPGAWVILGIVVACILAGFGYMFYKYWTKIRVPWNGLKGYRHAAVYVEPGNTTFNAARLVAALLQAEQFLKQYTQYTLAQYDAAFERICVYVKKDDAWKDGAGTKVAGQDPDGPVVVVGADLAALLHEMAHQLQEAAGEVDDYKHETWGPKGFAAADVPFQEWLKTAS